MFEICSKSTLKTPERSHRLYCLWTYFTPVSSVSIVDFKQVNFSWVLIRFILSNLYGVMGLLQAIGKISPCCVLIIKCAVSQCFSVKARLIEVLQLQSQLLISMTGHLHYWVLKFSPFIFHLRDLIIFKRVNLYKHN